MEKTAMMEMTAQKEPRTPRQTSEKFRRETENGVFTILTFKPKTCSYCGNRLGSRNDQRAKTLRRCITCVCRENGTFRYLLKQLASPIHYDENGEYYDEMVNKKWWVSAATINLET